MVAWLVCLTIILIAYAFQFAVILLLERRRQAHMIAWLLIVMVCPFVGFAAYVVAGKRIKQRIGNKRNNADNNENYVNINKIVHEKVDEQMNNEGLKSQARLLSLLAELTPFPITGQNRTKILTNGEETFETILEELHHANHHIHLDYYTIRNDGIGGKFLKTLVKKAHEGVEVRVIYDGIGSLGLDQTFLDRLHNAGAHTACFSPPRKALLNRSINFRNHRKIVVVDGKVGFLGGINIGDEYVGLDKKLGFWRDTHMQINGEAVYQLQQLFMRDWFSAANIQLPDNEHYFPRNYCHGEERVLIVPGKPGINDQKIVEVLASAMAAAKTRIYATTPYFIPDPSLATNLRIAARSGVEVKLIIPGISDSKLVLLATLSYVQDMLEAGVQIYRYQKGFIHAKVLIVDSLLATVGTANLDMRSLFSNYELLALLFDEHPIRKLEADFLQDLAHSEPIDLEIFKRRSKKQKAAEELMHMLSPLL
ncbi:cardiolipin synthase [Paenibacillus sp. L3-i20]|uniref:cardiolipin synthase n=1 Tax=Paenibacillus sp. L3-i20 TaxID=2905833 RepID=UPI001EDE87C3|nr:cardiolipin synthase [Paenibacillus sp. L3-i20]GKU80399.1 cardiolipin synthase [Paenibacillus sp. L3-i20]